MLTEEQTLGVAFPRRITLWLWRRVELPPAGLDLEKLDRWCRRWSDGLEPDEGRDAPGS
jgi:hypothetical protein